MKNLLVFACCLVIFENVTAQVPTAMPPDATVFSNNAMPVIRQQVKDIIVQTARAIKNYNANADSLSQRLRKNNALKGMSYADIDGITVLIMVQASKEADADLKVMVLEMSRSNDQKKEQRTTTQPVSVNNANNRNSSAEEISEMQSLRLLVIMERKRRMAAEISSVMKRIAGDQQNIINNLK